MKQILLVMLFTGTVASAQDRPHSMEQLRWISGCWENRSETRLSQEYWLPPVGDAMLGVNRLVRDGKLRFYEFLRIRQIGDSILYIVKPSGQKEASFTLIEVSDSLAVFENPEHDFPQRIVYQLNGDGTLAARIEGMQNGKERVENFPYRRGKCD